MKPTEKVSSSFIAPAHVRELASLPFAPPVKFISIGAGIYQSESFARTCDVGKVVYW
jgi:hypothetical protein